MSKSKSNDGTGSGLLGVLFIILKLVGLIDWSWWYVTLPFWGTSLILLLAEIVIIRNKRKETSQEFD